MEGQGTKVAVTNGLAVGSVATVGEIYDYTKSGNPKALTQENIYNSVYSTGVETSKGALWGNMPLGASIVGNIVTDKVVTGNADVGKNIQSGVLGTAVDSTLQGKSNAFIREGLVKFAEKAFELPKTEKDKE